MESLVVGSFNNSNICTFLLNQRPCWIAVNVAELFGYENPSKAISRCIKKENLNIGTAYDVLTKIDLYKFKQILLQQGYDRFNRAPRIVMLYEQGLLAFIKYTEKPIGEEFNQWLIENVFSVME
ncbi:MAG: BRO family protein [Sarcina sp.]